MLETDIITEYTRTNKFWDITNRIITKKIDWLKNKSFKRAINWLNNLEESADQDMFTYQSFIADKVINVFIRSDEKKLYV